MFYRKKSSNVLEPKKEKKPKEISDKETPLMGQYKTIKAKYPDAILLFRVGDFYETFSNDAVITSKVLGIVLTKRANGAATFVDLAGFPYHALDTYLPKLVRAGYRVAICDQLEDPKLTKTIVKRGVTEMITPGVTDNEKLLDHKANNFLCALHFGEKNIGLAFVDISTGEFFTSEGNSDYIEKLLQSFKPSEIIFQKQRQKDFLQLFGNKFYTYTLEEWFFQYEYAYENMIKHFDVQSLKGFGIEEMNSAVVACGAALQYLSDTEHPNIKHITSVSRIEEENFVWLDRFTIRNLELLSAQNDNGLSLLQVIDSTISPMGARLLRKWIVLPLKHKAAIDERLNTVEFLLKETEMRDNLARFIKQIGDLERLIAKVSLGKISPREVVQLKRSLLAVEQIKTLLSPVEFPFVKKIADQLNPCHVLIERIENELFEDAPFQIAKGGIIKEGVSKELDELRYISHSGKDFLASIQERERQNTGIGSLKISYNSVFGYYLEVTNTHKEKVPATWIRKQTLSNAERYITEELKEYETKILGAEEKILSLEQKLFEDAVRFITDYVSPVQLNASLIARMDVLLSFANTALKNNYHKPVLTDEILIDIKNGRHPVIEQRMEIGEQYVPNDIFLDNAEQQIIIITGPNMAGKSALIRQCALIVLMAQMGSFVPASSAKIGLIDKIFTRVGASDNISSGESTFMVEMSETASILNNISERSLIILDEIGRGTSTYDGISIAWSIAEYLHNNAKAKPLTLFATHYHELNELEEKFSRIKNFNVSVKEVGNKVIFLRKLIPGGTQHSFGIHVARMAGIPSSVINSANEILAQLEERVVGHEDEKLVRRPTSAQKEFQLNMFQLDDPKIIRIRQMLEEVDINTLTPIEAMMKLNEIKKMSEQ